MSLGVAAFEGAFITAQDAIYSANLSAFEHLSLFTFLLHSRIPAKAGQYVLDRISQNPEFSVEETLRSIRTDLNTLVLKCKLGLIHHPYYINHCVDNLHRWSR